MAQAPELQAEVARLRAQGYEIQGETETDLRTQCFLATVDLAAKLLDAKPAAAPVSVAAETSKAA